MALSHVLSRNQLLDLKYFSTVTRVNSRLRGLINEGLVKRLETPFFSQSLYMAAPAASEVVGLKIGPLLASRSGTPRFLQHALSVTNTRIALMRKGASAWRFEQQLKADFISGGKTLEVRPDGLAMFRDKGLLAVEVDLGHVNPAKFAEKLRAYDAFIATGECERAWGESTFRLLTLTTGSLRAKHLARSLPSGSTLIHDVLTFDQFGVQAASNWS
jgi:hypothetical protein